MIKYIVITSIIVIAATTGGTLSQEFSKKQRHSGMESMTDCLHWLWKTSRIERGTLGKMDATNTKIWGKTKNNINYECKQNGFGTWDGKWSEQ